MEYYMGGFEIIEMMFKARWFYDSCITEYTRTQLLNNLFNE